jgi:hypothetical protein
LHDYQAEKRDKVDHKKIVPEETGLPEVGRMAKAILHHWIGMADDMREWKYITETVRAYYGDWAPEIQEFGLEIFVGAARDVSKEPHAIALLLDSPIQVEGREYDRLDIGVFKPEMGLSPEGKAVIKVVFPSSYGYWRALSADSSRYSAEKDRIGKMVVSLLKRDSLACPRRWKR